MTEIIYLILALLLGYFCLRAGFIKGFEVGAYVGRQQCLQEIQAKVAYFEKQYAEEEAKKANNNLENNKG